VKVAVVVRTWNVVETHREELLLRTLASIQKTGHEAEFLLVDNSSDDAATTAFLWKHTRPPFSLRLQVWGYPEIGYGRGKPGLGVNRAVQAALAEGPDLICFSDDDIEWTPGWLRPVVSFFEKAPGDVVLLSGLMEPVWDWNRPCGVVEAGGVKTLQRASVPGASWMFRAADWAKIGPVAEDRTHDVAGCKRLVQHGYKLCALDLAEHAGYAQSTLGNTVASGQPVNLKAWGIE
jgi:glycosyltransferase involved in cell wall biosynthesis